jgi:hypothetical protein
VSHFDERAAARASWPVAKVGLADDDPARGPDDPSAAWNAVIELSREAYAAMGVRLTSVPRSEWPSRLYRPGEPRPDTNGL